MAKYIKLFSVLLLSTVSSLASPQDVPSSVTGGHFSTAGSEPALESVQAPADTGQSDLAYFQGQQDAIHADAARLQAEMDDLQKKYAADPNAGLRDQIRAREAFVARLHTERAEALKFVSPTLAVTLDWVARDAQDAADGLKADLNARLRVPNPERAAMKAQIDKLQRELDLKDKLAKTLADKINSLHDDRRRDGVVSELDALAKTTGSTSLAGAAAATVTSLDKEQRK